MNDSNRYNLYVGCGYADNLNELFEDEYEGKMIGIDTSMDTCIIAKSSELDEVICCDAFKLPFRLKSIDTVFIQCFTALIFNKLNEIESVNKKHLEYEKSKKRNRPIFKLKRELIQYLNQEKLNEPTSIAFLKKKHPLPEETTISIWDDTNWKIEAGAVIYRVFDTGKKLNVYWMDDICDFIEDELREHWNTVLKYLSNYIEYCQDICYGKFDCLPSCSLQLNEFLVESLKGRNNIIVETDKIRKWRKGNKTLKNVSIPGIIINYGK